MRFILDGRITSSALSAGIHIYTETRDQDRRDEPIIGTKTLLVLGSS